MSSVDSYVEKTLSLLGTERAAEQEELVSELGRIRFVRVGGERGTEGRLTIRYWYLITIQQR